MARWMPRFGSGGPSRKKSPMSRRSRAGSRRRVLPKSERRSTRAGGWTGPRRATVEDALSPSPGAPEQRARAQIDAALIAAGWILQGRDDMNLSAGRGVAIREFRLATGHGFADYLLFVDGKAVGVLEAKPEGHTLSGVEVQTEKYSSGLPAGLNPPVEPLPFLYLSTGTITKFTNLLDPDPRSRRIFQIHQPGTLAEWLAADTLDAWVKGARHFTEEIRELRDRSGGKVEER